MGTTRLAPPSVGVGSGVAVEVAVGVFLGRAVSVGGGVVKGLELAGRAAGLGVTVGRGVVVADGLATGRVGLAVGFEVVDVGSGLLSNLAASVSVGDKSAQPVKCTTNKSKVANLKQLRAQARTFDFAVICVESLTDLYRSPFHEYFSIRRA